jgi:SAM-dependent methyltransferase
MLSISDNWRSYFDNHHEGLGTTYERFILHHHFSKIREQFAVSSVIEIPSFGMTGVSGINSMWWALQGVPVTVVDDVKERLELIRKIWKDMSLPAEFIHHPLCESGLPFGDKSFDMGWNFASLWFVPGLESFLGELARITKKAIFICVPNRLGLGYAGRLAFRNDHDTNLFLKNIIPGRIKKSMLNHGWKVADQGFMDVPPWPDIAMKKEDLLQKLGFGRLAARMQNKEDNYLCILDYYSGKKTDMESEIMKYAVLENSSRIVKRFWAHHWYAVFYPRQL